MQSDKYSGWVIPIPFCSYHSKRQVHYTQRRFSFMGTRGIFGADGGLHATRSRGVTSRPRGDRSSLPGLTLAWSVWNIHEPASAIAFSFNEWIMTRGSNHPSRRDRYHPVTVARPLSFQNNSGETPSCIRILYKNLSVLNHNHAEMRQVTWQWLDEWTLRGDIFKSR